MASPPGAGGSRYAGRVVDPDVRDDGETEPEVELAPSAGVEAAPATEAETATEAGAATDADAAAAEAQAHEYLAAVDARFGGHGARVLAGDFNLGRSATDDVLGPAGYLAPAVGDTIEWINRDILAHTATARNDDWEVTIEPEKTARTVLSKAGTIEYYCRYHPNMTGRIVVSAK